MQRADNRRTAAGTDTDVAVIGGGPAGAATALALRRLRPALRVTVIEAGCYDRVRPGETIPPDARPVLERLGLWPLFLADGHRPSHGSRSAWGDATPGYNDFIVNPNGPGWHLDRLRFDAMLLSALVGAGVDMRLGARAHLDQQLEPGAAGHGLRIRQDGRETWLSARFLVDATGPAAALARRLGGARRCLDRMTFRSCYFRKPDPWPDQTQLEAVADGWWYAAGLPDGRVIVSHAGATGTTGARGSDRATSGPDRFRDWLTRLAATRLVGPALAASHPLSDRIEHAAAFSFLLQPMVGSNWLAVGDAAAAYDPISSAGITKGLAMGLAAAETIGAWEDGDEGAALQRYAACRARDFAAYARMRSQFYRAETRWPESRFWLERQRAA